MATGWAPTAVGAGASQLDVREGVLGLTTAPGVAISLSLEPIGFPEQHAFRALDFGDGVFTSFSDQSEAWPGGVPPAGVGCGPQAHPDASYVCEGVASVDLSGAEQPDLLTVLGNPGSSVPVRLAGGGGRDGLMSLQTGETEIDGGPGNDALLLDRGIAHGGPGNDEIEIRELPTPPGEKASAAPRFAPTTIDCGPGSDILVYPTVNGQRLPATVDAASCPPVITPLRRYRPRFPGDFPMIRLPTSRRLRMTILETTEELRGKVRARATGGLGGRCTRAKRFRVAAGQTVRVTLRLTAEAVRRSRATTRAGAMCNLALIARDPQGDRVAEALPFLMRPHSGGGNLGPK
jgi:hypothetical protein